MLDISKPICSYHASFENNMFHSSMIHNQCCSAKDPSMQIMSYVQLPNKTLAKWYAILLCSLVPRHHHTTHYFKVIYNDLKLAVWCGFLCIPSPPHHHFDIIENYEKFALTCVFFDKREMYQIRKDSFDQENSIRLAHNIQLIKPTVRTIWADHLNRPSAPSVRPPKPPWPPISSVWSTVWTGGLSWSFALSLVVSCHLPLQEQSVWPNKILTWFDEEFCPKEFTKASQFSTDSDVKKCHEHERGEKN